MGFCCKHVPKCSKCSERTAEFAGRCFQCAPVGTTWTDGASTSTKIVCRCCRTGNRVHFTFQGQAWITRPDMCSPCYMMYVPDAYTADAEYRRAAGLN